VKDNWKEVVIEALRKSVAPDSVLAQCKFINLSLKVESDSVEEYIKPIPNPFKSTYNKWVSDYPIRYLQAYPYLPKQYQNRESFKKAAGQYLHTAVACARTMLTKEELEDYIAEWEDYTSLQEAKAELLRRIEQQENFMENLIDSL